MSLRIKLDLDEDTTLELIELAVAERRSIVHQAEFVLRDALRPRKERTDERREHDQEPGDEE